MKRGPAGLEGGLSESRVSAEGRIVVLELPLRRPVIPDSFTPAECEVAKLVFDGLTNAEIGKTRGTSEKTVANQVARLLKKAGVQSRVQLVLRLLGQDVAG